MRYEKQFVLLSYMPHAFKAYMPVMPGQLAFLYSVYIGSCWVVLKAVQVEIPFLNSYIKASF